MTFPCVKCGMCCRNVGIVDRSLDRGDGICMNLSEDNLCNIYNDRPKICRIDEIRPIGIKKKQWYEINIEACKKLGAKM